MTGIPSVTVFCFLLLTIGTVMKKGNVQPRFIVCWIAELEVLTAKKINWISKLSRGMMNQLLLLRTLTLPC